MTERTYEGATKYGEMTLSVEYVTPAIAARWLEHNNANRRIRRGVVAQYARDMEESAWRRKPIAICFDSNGALGNGQHTLNAIVASGRAQELLISRNTPSETIAVMDLGIRRTLSDVAHFLGMGEMDARRGAIARVLGFGPGDTEPRSFGEVFSAYQEHAEVIEFSVGLSPKKCGINASVLAVCARASYTHDRSRIARFIEVLNTGVVSDPSEVPAIRLRDWSRSLRGGFGSQIKVETYQKAETGLLHFIRKTQATKLYGTPTELFPLPGEDSERVDRYLHTSSKTKATQDRRSNDEKALTK